MELIVIAHLKVRAGKRQQFEAFERQALALIERHGGKLLQAMRPVGAVPPAELPDEVHVLRFPGEEALAAYRADPGLAALAGLRAEAIESTQLLIGSPLAQWVEYYPS